MGVQRRAGNYRKPICPRRLLQRLVELKSLVRFGVYDPEPKLDDTGREADYT